MVRFKCTYRQVMDATMHHIDTINTARTHRELLATLGYSEHIYRAARLVGPWVESICRNLIFTARLKKYREIVSKTLGQNLK